MEISRAAVHCSGLGLLEIPVNAYLHAHAFVRRHSSFRRLDNIHDDVWLVHQAAAEAFFDCPALWTVPKVSLRLDDQLAGIPATV